MTPVLVALDFSTIGEARAMAEETMEHVGGFKVGLELLMAEGISAIGAIVELGRPVFADVKLHDIPNTVKAAAAKIATEGPRWVTVHGSGGRRMVEAAVEGLQAGAGPGQAPGVLAVTVLTSLDEADLDTLGLEGSLESHAIAVARLAAAAGAEGVVCSPREVAPLKAALPSMLRFTPGIRLAADSSDDQKRVSDPVAALAAGADWLVVGRAITSADDPRSAARAMAEMVDSGG